MKAKRKSINWQADPPFASRRFPACVAVAVLACGSVGELRATAADANSHAGAARPMIHIKAGLLENDLKVETGEKVEFRPDAPGATKWSEVNIGRGVVRFGSVQVAVVPRVQDGEIIAAHTFREPGWVLAGFSWGPRSERGKSDSWQRVTHCSKSILEVVPPGGTRDAARKTKTVNPAMTAKFGQKFEIVPLAPPPQLRVGSDLPVRVYSGFVPAKDSTVTFHHPNGNVESKTTDAVGISAVRIDQSGRWTVRFQTEHEGATCQAELIFEVSADDAEGGDR